MISFLLGSILFCFNTFAATEVNLTGVELERELNNTVETANDETVINLPAGKFFFKNELLITKAGITIRGRSPEATILSFKNQKAGPQGVLATNDRFRIEDLTVEDTAGNGIKVIGANNVQFINVRVRWTAKASRENGAYGVYPVLSKNILIENCEVSDASDAGIYVGQSTGILVRNNDAHHNVAGIEIENSDNADVVQNRAHNNTAGILVFNLPDLKKKDGKGAYIHNNDIYSNNGKNFSTKGSIINLVPKGLGYFSLASQRTEIADNRFRDHNLAHITVSNYKASERPIKDPSYDPMPRGVFIHNNDFGPAKITLPDGGRMNFIMKFLVGFKTQDIIYDGIFDGTYNGPKVEALDRICFGKQTTSSKLIFANLHLDYQAPHFPLPGRLTRDLAEHSCELPAVRPPEIDLNAGTVTSEIKPSEDEIRQACHNKTPNQINRTALEYDCPKLSDYNLFLNPKDPSKNPRDGFGYQLSNQLFTDYALKDRFIFLPQGESIDFRPEFSMEFPIGSVIAKSFSLKDPSNGIKLVETRLLIKRSSGWVPLNYVWEDNGNAHLERAGYVFAAKTQTPAKEILDINYHIPNLRQCASCHSINGSIMPIGPRAKFLNKENQLETWSRLGQLRNLPTTEVIKLPSWDNEAAPVDLRAKAYLEINCSHCHNPVGNARNTGLFFSTNRDSSSVEMGHCKTPVAAGFATGGNLYDVTPGQAEKSILYYRISHNHLAVKMPQLGRSVSHKEGNALIKRWIDQMPKVDCKKN